MLRHVIAVALVAGLPASASALEGPTAAGPIGGADMRSALMPPPGLYGGTIQGVAKATDFVDGDGKTLVGLERARIVKAVAGPFLYYVPDVTLFGGSVGFGAVLPFAYQRGKLFAGTSRESDFGMGDPYVEVNWGKFFGTLRPSKYPGAYPIPEGLAIMLGLGAVVPIGEFDDSDPLDQALSPGTGIWDIAPSLALTYTTAPWLAEGTEFSAKLFWNNYRTNKKTDYRTGDLLNLDFAVTEHIGRFQLGVQGTYIHQTEDDEIAGFKIPPDGRRADALQIGGVVAYDLPEYATSLKLKASTTPHSENGVKAWSVVSAWVTKF